MDVRERLRLIERWVELRSAPPPPRPREGEPVAVIRRRFPLHECGGVHSIDPSLLRHLTLPRLPEPPDHSSLLFLDIETTGLGTGPGNLPFLIGCGRIEGDSFTVDQHFLHHPDAWGEMLRTVRPLLEGSDVLVTFNGRQFDWPVLREAFRACGDVPLEPAHLDLLRPSRRLWRLRLGSATLRALEEGVLGIAREEDVPGWLVPAVYADYLHTLDPSLANLLLSHNLRDVLALPALLAEVATAVTDPASLREPADALGAGRILEEWEEVPAAATAYEKALQGGLARAFREKAVFSLASVYRRQGRTEELVRLLEEEAAGALRWSAPLHLELSRAYERHRGDLKMAYSAALRALEILTTDPTVDGSRRARLTEEIVRRLDHLERRLKRG